MRRIILPAAAAIVGLASPLAGASAVHGHGHGHGHGHRRHGTAATTSTPLWLAGKVSYEWSGDQCAPAAPPGSSGAAPASTPCHESFTNVVTASVSTAAGKVLQPLTGQSLRFTWYGDILTPETAGQMSCTIIVRGTGTASGSGGSGTISYASFTVSSPDCTIDTANGPASTKSLEAQGSCLSCNFDGYLGQPITISFSAPGYTVLDNDFPVNTNTL